MNEHAGNAKHTATISQWFLRASSRVGFSGLPFQIHALLILGFLFSLGRNIAFPYLATFMTGKSENGGARFSCFRQNSIHPSARSAASRTLYAHSPQPFFSGKRIDSVLEPFLKTCAKRKELLCRLRLLSLRGRRFPR